jgi:hypothetical protein
LKAANEISDIVVGLLNAGVALGTLLAAWFWLKSARIRVRDSQDDFIEDLQAIGKQSGYGAIAACIAAFCVFALWLRSIGVF